MSFIGKKKIILTAICIISLISGLGITASNRNKCVASSLIKLKITNGPLNVRRGNSTKTPVIGTIKKGKTVYATGSKKDKKRKTWYKIKLGKKTGYIISDYAKPYKTKKKKEKTSAKKAKNKKTYGITREVLNVRNGASTKTKKTGLLGKNKSVVILKKVKDKNGELWYQILFNGKKGYIAGAYVDISSGGDNDSSESGSDDQQTGGSQKNFEKYLKTQGFPESYKPYLRKMHKAHPKWVFIAQKTKINWSAYQKAACRIGVNLVDKSDPKSWRSKNKKVYTKYKTYTKDKKSGKKKTKTVESWTRFDGRWYQAKNSVIAYYTDPRNFLNDASIFQFMGHRFDKKSQTKDTIKSLVSSNPCFMNTSSYIKDIYNACKSAGVNPNVAAAMIIMEQGWRGGSGLISGRYKGYEGIYNFFNVGAFHGNGMNSIQRGLWWASGANKGRTSYGRPWNSRFKAIKGGVMFYAGDYINARQYTYYTKKFNVMNGVRNLAEHEYMTNVSGAQAEGELLKLAYRKNKNFPIKFYIPVFYNMPERYGSI